MFAVARTSSRKILVPWPMITAGLNSVNDLIVSALLMLRVIVRGI